jgi:predicted GNAT family N-acyltransferase
MTLIRKYNPQDRIRCLEIFTSNYPEFFDHTEIKGFEHWLNGLDNNRIVYPNSEGDHYFVLELDNTIVACGGYYVEKEKPRITMAWGMVNNLVHKQGFGKQLFQFRIEEIQRTLPNHSIIIDTSQHTFKFFQKFGFKVDKITKDGYGAGLDKYDMKR